MVSVRSPPRKISRFLNDHYLMFGLISVILNKSITWESCINFSNLLTITVLHTTTTCTKGCTRPDVSYQREIVLFRQYYSWRSPFELLHVILIFFKFTLLLLLVTHCCYIILLSCQWDKAVWCCCIVCSLTFPSLYINASGVFFYRSLFNHSTFDPLFDCEGCISSRYNCHYYLIFRLFSFRINLYSPLDLSK